MLKKTIKYEDFDGTMKEKTCLFNLTKAEVIEIGGNKTIRTTDKDALREIMNNNDPSKTVEIMKSIILAAYGEEIDGRFSKNKEMREAFAASPAYSELFIELATDDEAVTKFLLAVMPKGMDVESALEEGKKLIEDYKS